MTFCRHVRVPALFQMTPGRPASHDRPVPAVAVPLLPGRRWLAVIGAVGQPRDGNPAACYALLHHEHSTLTYVRVPYDIDAAAQKIVKAGRSCAFRLSHDEAQYSAAWHEMLITLACVRSSAKM